MYYKKQIDNRGVATVTLNRPELHNAFNDEMISDLIECFNKLAQNENVRVVVLTGTGKSFCAGADLNWMKRMKDYSYEENLKDTENLAELFTVINKFKKPTIARVNGSALGGGAGFLACCDYVIAIDTVSFAFTEVRLGLLPAVISPFVIAKIGESHARATFMSGMRFNASKAMMMGLVHQISSFDKLDEDLEVIINEFLQAAPNASAMAKELIAEVVRKPSIEEARSYSCEMISKVRTGNEGQEGMNALLEKRKASWL
ncbi:MAG: enoyl-CoA hydratase/isomerase family protein [Bacteriovorax sp.]|nr:enoyl-CoA hydratase/isomerase family protein [Bacteriovorax sp.]